MVLIVPVCLVSQSCFEEKVYCQEIFNAWLFIEHWSSHLGGWLYLRPPFWARYLWFHWEGFHSVWLTVSIRHKGHPDTSLNLRSGWKLTWRERLWLLTEMPGQLQGFPPTRRLSFQTTSLLSSVSSAAAALSRGPFVLTMQLSRVLTGSISWMKQTNVRTSQKDL